MTERRLWGTRKAVWLARVFVIAMLIAGCIQKNGQQESNDHYESAELNAIQSAEHGLGVLHNGEVVLSIDELPHGPADQAIFDYLGQEKIVALLFLVGERVGEVTRQQGLVFGTNVKVYNNVYASLERALSNGHLIGNHTFSHPVAGAKTAYNPNGCSYSDLILDAHKCHGGKEQAIREIVWTQQLIYAAINRVGNQFSSQMRPWFRSSGGSWGHGVEKVVAEELKALKSSVFDSFVAPVLWTVPRPATCGILVQKQEVNKKVLQCLLDKGEMPDWQCFQVFKLDSSLMSPEKCAAGYMKAIELASAQKQGGLILLHGNLVRDNFNFSLETIKILVTKIKNATSMPILQSKYKIVHPDCAITDTRKNAEKNGWCL